MMNHVPRSDGPEGLVLRGHHLLCVLGFRGLGYAPRFVANMNAIVDSYFGEPSPTVRVVASADDICAACPHRVGESCALSESSDECVRAKDEAVLRLLGLEPGARLPASALREQVAESIFPLTLETLCADCRWHARGYCGEGLAALRAHGGRAHR